MVAVARRAEAGIKLMFEERALPTTGAWQEKDEDVGKDRLPRRQRSDPTRRGESPVLGNGLGALGPRRMGQSC